MKRTIRVVLFNQLLGTLPFLFLLTWLLQLRSDDAVTVLGVTLPGERRTLQEKLSWKPDWWRIGDFALDWEFVAICPADTHDELASHLDQVSSSTDHTMSVRFVDLEWPRDGIENCCAGRGPRFGRTGFVRCTLR